MMLRQKLAEARMEVCDIGLKLVTHSQLIEKVSDELEQVTAERDELKRQLQTWLDVFGHLSKTADEAGNTIYNSSGEHP